MKRLFLLCISLILLSACHNRPEGDYDICIYGGTSSGVIAARSAAQLGLDVLIVEPTRHIGGLTTGGLGQTDIGNKHVVKGLSKRFYRQLGTHYGSLEKWVFEPKEASRLFAQYLDHPRITVLKGYGLDDVVMEGDRIASVCIQALCEDGAPDTTREVKLITAKEFIDASYEGDLMAAAGVSYTTGREDASQYGESWNGYHLAVFHQFPDGIDPYRVPGKPESGLLWGVSDNKPRPDGSGDALFQAYNIRICLTDSTENMIPLTQPEGYDPERYELLARLVAAQPADTNYFIWSPMPGRKTDINNFGGFSTDMIGENQDYINSDYAGRYRIWKAHSDYAKGVLWFMGHDPRVPEILRQRYGCWGYPKDEYLETDHWTPQMYVREGRRMVSDYVATQADCEHKRAPEDGIALAAYQMDSHNCQRIVITKNGRAMVKNEGDVEIGTPGPYPISYRSIVPKRGECANLFVPVDMSSSHIAFGSIRMEPVFMTLGQVAAMGADLAIKGAQDGKPLAVQDVDWKQIVARMDADPYLDGTQPEIVIDDIDSQTGGAIEATAGWTVVSKNRGYGLKYFELAASDPAEHVTFRTGVPKAGKYALYSYLNLHDKLAPVTCYDITVDGQVQPRVRIDAASIPLIGQMKGDWASLGEFQVKEGVSVTLSGEASPLPLRADAILLVPRP